MSCLFCWESASNLPKLLLSAAKGLLSNQPPSAHVYELQEERLGRKRTGEFVELFARILGPVQA